MKKHVDEPLRGEAAWQAARRAVAQRNDAARRRGGELRAAADAVQLARREADEAREYEHLPVQPRP